MSDQSVHKIRHIVGERIFWLVRLFTDGVPADLSDCDIAFRGKLNGATAYDRPFSLYNSTTVRFRCYELIDENADKRLEGRFFFTFPDTSVRASQQILIVVKQ